MLEEEWWVGLVSDWNGSNKSNQHCSKLLQEEQEIWGIHDIDVWKVKTIHWRRRWRYWANQTVEKNVKSVWWTEEPRIETDHANDDDDNDDDEDNDELLDALVCGYVYPFVVARWKLGNDFPAATKKQLLDSWF